MFRRSSTKEHSGRCVSLSLSVRVCMCVRVCVCVSVCMAWGYVREHACMIIQAVPFFFQVDTQHLLFGSTVPGGAIPRWLDASIDYLHGQHSS